MQKSFRLSLIATACLLNWQILTVAVQSKSAIQAPTLEKRTNRQWSEEQRVSCDERSKYTAEEARVPVPKEGVIHPMQKATFGAGCFWGIEETFRKVKGVKSTLVGYSGGTFKNPTYEDVCSGKTGHAEVIEVEYDPSIVSYQELLDVFWNAHDPTTLNRQGPDHGEQYRSVIFFHTAEQEAQARASREKLEASKQFKDLIVTQIQPAMSFFRAEEYHQQYLQKRGLNICH